MTEIILFFIFIMSFIAFVVMGYDKSQAKKHGKRVRERTLWMLAIFGGGIGAYVGMQMFRHKTKHTNFRVGFLMLLVLYAFLIFWIVKTNNSFII
ncbi:DUF1294 domain-containing protein [Psychrobacillus vulpis]|uniref:DUF1294 domain-containing protein n=1 Tax=Psychrobacillus vulpis TaxID=2325572 RepID=A0A544TQV1_9BACI|nr:DUF1294 domain-containing protein [Psychrobacillus vulpis]TQR19834.1 DUF1294 domain-containing protein [Psychrobacillus vulpis]